MLHLPLHPMVVHFPIALFVSALGLEFLSLILKKESLHQTALQIYILASVVAPLVAWTGLEEAEELHLVKHPVLDLHRALALFTMGLALVTLPILWIAKKRIAHSFRVIFFIFLVLVVSAVTFTDYNGGRLVYEYGVGVEEK